MSPAAPMLAAASWRPQSGWRWTDFGGMPISSGRLCWIVGLSILAFQVAFTWPFLRGGILLAAIGLIVLRNAGTSRKAFYGGLALGFGVFVPQTTFLWTIFGVAALPLWAILASFHGMFVVLLQRLSNRWDSVGALVLAPILWCGIEYFRSEVWWLRFSWFSLGSVFLDGQEVMVRRLGVYGMGFAVMALAAALVALSQHRPRSATGVAVISMILMAHGAWWTTSPPDRSGDRGLQLAGVQLEVPGVPEVTQALEHLRRTSPEAPLIVLSEYTFDDEVPRKVKDWCRKHQRWLVAGGREYLEGDSVRRDRKWLRSFLPNRTSRDFYNTAFVINTNGDVVFKQAKSRPVQFFDDGVPAPQQQVWSSPWGRIGIAICYDASYRQVTDSLVRQGAELLVIPTMDLEAWGEHQHRLNARMARLLAMEYGIPIFRVASSGISQAIDVDGKERATAPFPGSGAELAADLRWSRKAPSVPWDALLAPVCSWITLGVVVVLGVLPRATWRRSLRVAS